MRAVQRFDEIDMLVDHGLTRRLTVSADDPLSARSVITQYYEMGRDGWRIRIETEAEMTGTAEGLSAHRCGARLREWGAGGRARLG